MGQGSSGMGDLPRSPGDVPILLMLPAALLLSNSLAHTEQACCKRIASPHWSVIWTGRTRGDYFPQTALESIP